MNKLKFTAAAAALVMMCSCSSGETEKEGEKSLYQQGIAVISMMDEMVSSDDYGLLIAGSSEITEMADQIAEGDYSQPKAVYEIENAGTAVLSLLSSSSSAFNNMSEPLKEYTQMRLYNSIAMQVNSKYSATCVAASSAYSAGKVFVNSSISGNKIYIYLYEESYPVMVSFEPGEDNAVTASGMFIFDDEFKDSEEQDINELLENSSVLSTAKPKEIEMK